MPDPLDDAVLALTRVSRILERAAAPLSVADFRALSAIADGEARASRLAQRLAVGKPSISATVDSLVRRGLIVRGRVDGDQRAVDLTVTDAGRTVCAEALDRMRAQLARIVERLDDPEPGLRWLGELSDAIEAARRDESRA